MNTIFDISRMITLAEPVAGVELFIHTSEKEILRISLDQHTLKDPVCSDDDDTFHRIFTNLLKHDQRDVIRFIYNASDRVQNIIHGFKFNRKVVDLMTADRKRRQLSYALFSGKSTRTYLKSTNLWFVLLQKKECKLVKQLLKLTPSLAHKLDEDGNDPLLYVCHNVRGCQHRLLELLVEMKYDVQRSRGYPNG